MAIYTAGLEIELFSLEFRDKNYCFKIMLTEIHVA